MLTQMFGRRGAGKTTCPLQQDRLPAAGIEYFLPVFFDSTALVTDYLPKNTTVCLRPGITEAIDEFWADTRGRHAIVRGDLANPVLPPQELFLTEEAFFGAIKPFPRIDLAAIAPAMAGSPAAELEFNNKNTYIDIGSTLNPMLKMEGWKGSRAYLREYWLNDNRNFLNDSRIFGPVSGDLILGKVVLKYWPVNEFSLY